MTRLERLTAGANLLENATSLRQGQRIILNAHPGSRFGNYLYFLLQGYVRQAQGDNFFVRTTPAMQQWLEHFPHAQRYAISEAELNADDIYEWDGTDDCYYQHYGRNFSQHQLHAFIKNVLLQSPKMAEREEVPLAIHIRRGDYYSNMRNRELYGFDYQSYLDEALTLVDTSQGITVVSDDPQWCSDNLRLPENVTYAPRWEFDNFRTMSNAKQLIASNSSFAYWPGYIGDVWFPEHKVIVPQLHNRAINNNEPYQHDANWISLPVKPWVESTNE